ncbi:MAG: S41 family peptidase [Bryobacteraceae bacterium]
MRGFRLFGALGVLAVLAATPLPAQLSAREKQLNVDSFETVWTTVRDKHWEQNPGGLNWQAIHTEFLPKVEAAGTMDEARAAMREMLTRLQQTHFAIVASDVYENVAADGGDAWPGFSVRVLNGAVVVSSLNSETPGVKPGWELLSVDGIDLREFVRKLQANPGVQEMAIQRALLSQMRGPTGKRRRFEFRPSTDESAPPVTKEIALLPPKGNATTFGNLPTQYVWFESRMIGNIGIISFNAFLDLVRVMGQFGSVVQGCSQCDGLIIDLRGNPGGIGGMAMGMAGWLVEKQNLRLGTMYMRGATLGFVINPRADAYLGPLAILVDGTSASTSEIFAGGLKDIGRARIFGTRTAAAALPSVFMRLSNGDGFQYAIANYISQGGSALERNGVTPDQEVRLTRDGLLAGRDAVVEAALDWIRQQRGK